MVHLFSTDKKSRKDDEELIRKNWRLRQYFPADSVYFEEGKSKNQNARLLKP